MLKSIQSCATCVHVEISHIKGYHVYEQIYMITVSVVSLFYMIMCHTCLTFIIIIVYFYYLLIRICSMYNVYFSSCGAILSLIAYHLSS